MVVHGIGIFWLSMTTPNCHQDTTGTFGPSSWFSSILIHLQGSLQFWSIFMVLLKAPEAPRSLSFSSHILGTGRIHRWSVSRGVCSAEDGGTESGERDARGGIPRGLVTSLTCDRFFEEGCCTNGRYQMTR